MIVIPTHNGYNHLINLKVGLVNSNNKDQKVCYVDNGSTDKATKILLSSCKTVIRLEESRYEFGALAAAYNSFPDEPEYILLHDSIKFVSPNWGAGLIEASKSNEAVALALFDNLKFCTLPEEAAWIISLVGKDSWDEYAEVTPGIFGSIGCYTNEAMVKLKAAGFLDSKFQPSNKVQSQAMERFVPLMLKLSGIDFVGLGTMQQLHVQGLDGIIKSHGFRQ